MKQLARVVGLVIVVAGSARAHVGASVAKASYLHPAAPGRVGAGTDGGSATDYSKYVPEEANASYRIDWADGDADPTGRFTFYYLDHAISDAVSAEQVEQIGKLVRDVKGRDAAGIFVACSCEADAGVECPKVDGGARWCDNFVDWDTSGLTDGAYWIAAVNNDPPFHVYNLSFAPVRVHHGAAKPPVVIVVRPDGLLDADRSYRVAVVAVGTGAMTLQLAYGQNDVKKVLGPVSSIAKQLPAVAGAEGLVGYEWAIAEIPNGSYFVRATVTDGSGQSYADSRYGLAVYHAPGDDGGATPADLAVTGADMAKMENPAKGCSCAVGGAGGGGGGLALLLLLVAAWRRFSPASGGR
ncbi:MAG: hypothetical protein EXR72_04295 [Myxococcales bacterium]|nr:hypothetical protein [Myxococcales bacterium]